MKTIRFILFATSLLCFSKSALADLNNTFLFTMNTIYLDRDFNDNGVTYQSKTTDTDFRLGKVFRRYYAGAIYSQSSSDASDANRTSYGLSGGYYSEKDLYIVGHYFFSSRYALGAGSEETKGSGYEIDIGGLFRFTSSFYLGLMVAYKTFNYDERTVNGVSSSSSVSHREIMPLFTIGFALQ